MNTLLIILTILAIVVNCGIGILVLNIYAPKFTKFHIGIIQNKEELDLTDQVIAILLVGMYLMTTSNWLLILLISSLFSSKNTEEKKPQQPEEPRVVSLHTAADEPPPSKL